MTESCLAMKIADYWPFMTVCICALLLVMIALAALLLLKEQGKLVDSWKIRHPVLNGMNRRNGESKQQTELQFFRIGRDIEVQSFSLFPDCWYTVGGGKKADFVLCGEDHRLEELHFRMRRNGSVLLLETLDGETSVNGVPIRQLGAVQVYSTDLIRAGSYEYRVIFSSREERENDQ